MHVVRPLSFLMLAVKIPWASLIAQLVKNPPAMQETWVQSLGWEHPLEKGTAAHSGIFAWRIPWTEEPGELQSMGCRVWHTWATFTHKNTMVPPVASSVFLVTVHWAASQCPDRGLQQQSAAWASPGRQQVTYLAGCRWTSTVLPVTGQHVGSLVNQNFPNDLQGLV